MCTADEQDVSGIRGLPYEKSTFLDALKNLMAQRPVGALSGLKRGKNSQNATDFGPLTGKIKNRRLGDRKRRQTWAIRPCFAQIGPHTAVFVSENSFQQHNFSAVRWPGDVPVFKVYFIHGLLNE